VVFGQFNNQSRKCTRPIFHIAILHGYPAWDISGYGLLGQILRDASTFPATDSSDINFTGTSGKPCTCVFSSESFLEVEQLLVEMCHLSCLP